MVNSSWTKGHIDYALSYKDFLLDILHFPFAVLTFFGILPALPPRVASARIVYPPCDTREMAQFPYEGRERVILSIAQFRYVGFPPYGRTFSVDRPR